MNVERQAQAREVLPTEEAKKAFDCLCDLYPDAAIFWDTEGQFAELELNNTTIRVS